MKKHISVILMIFFMLLTLIGCNNADTSVDDTTNDDNSSVLAFNDPIKDYDTVDETSAEGFVIKAKKYVYGENNAVILSAENQSDKNYTVSINMTYYDDAGNEITQESQLYESFAANWQKYFAFDPGIPFSSYDFTVTTEEYVGECYAQYVEISFGGLSETMDNSVDLIEKYGDYTKFPTIMSTCYEKNSSGYQLKTGYHLVVIDNTGKIFSIGSCGGLIGAYAKGENYSNMQIIQFLDGELIWPDELKKDILGIVVLGNTSLYG